MLITRHPQAQLREVKGKSHRRDERRSQARDGEMEGGDKEEKKRSGEVSAVYPITDPIVATINNV